MEKPFVDDLRKLTAKSLYFSMSIIAGLILSPSISPAASRSTEPIRIILNNWTSQTVLANILGRVYEYHGYTVEFSKVSTKIQWSRLHRGLDHIQVEVWEGTMSQEFGRVIEFGHVIDAGQHSATTREEWWYPSYVEDICPGLPDWKALRDCAKLFSDSPDSDVGRYIAGPWEKPEKDRIRALKMRFSVDTVEKASDLWVKLETAYRAKAPIVIFNWTPNWVEDRYKGSFVEFPTYDPKCESDPTWGTNKELTFDCGNPKNGWLKKAAWSGLEKNWPCAAQILRDMNFTNAMISHVSAMVVADGLTVDQAADKWIKNQQDVWEKWGRDICNG